eukprot:6464889-Amphidinium_carterae.1
MYGLASACCIPDQLTERLLPETYVQQPRIRIPGRINAKHQHGQPCLYNLTRTQNLDQVQQMLGIQTKANKHQSAKLKFQTLL